MVVGLFVSGAVYGFVENKILRKKKHFSGNDVEKKYQEKKYVNGKKERIRRFFGIFEELATPINRGYEFGFLGDRRLLNVVDSEIERFNNHI